MSVKVHEAFSFDSFQDRLLFFDDFHGDQLNDEWRSTGDAGGSAAVVDAQTGGICRITTDGDDTDNWTLDWTNIRSLHVDQQVTMEVRVKLTQTTNVDVHMQLRFDASNRIYFHYDSDVDAYWHLHNRDGGDDTTLDSEVAADTSYHVFRIECHTHGSNHVHYYIDGTECANSPVSTHVPDDAGDLLQPKFYIATREDATKSMDIDYVYIRQERG